MKEITVKDLKPAYYNPRTMSQETHKALEASIEAFEDISGITWNKKTKNIVTGHHRWSALVNKYGEENLSFKKLTKTRYSILANDEDTEFVLRVVDWDESKEKAANIAGNSKTLMGEFTADLDNLLDDIELDYGNIFNDLKFDDLRIDVSFEDIEKEEKKTIVHEHERSTPDYSDKNKEIDVDIFGDDLDHKCPKCGFEFND